MPEPLTVDEFIDNTLSDLKTPLQSDFISKISNVRSTVCIFDESLECDRNILLRTKKLVKSVVSSGCGYADNVLSFCDHLEKLGQNALDSNEPSSNDVASSFYKFSVVHRDLANMLKHTMQNMNNILLFPLETFMQGDIKCDLKKPFDKALKDYEYKYDKLRKEKLQAMKDTGIYVPETFTSEMIEDLDQERRRLQLEACEYFIKVNELKFKRSADLLQHLIDFYYTHHHHFRECLLMMEHFGKTIDNLNNRINAIQVEHHTQKRRLIDTREEIRLLCVKEPIQAVPTYTGRPVQTNLAYGTRKTGFLLKKSEGKVKRVWQRRRVHIGDGQLLVYHADESKPPVRLPLLTCQLKLPNDQAAADGLLLCESNAPAVTDNRNHFHLISNSRTYNFQAEDDQEYGEWISILTNALQEEFQRAMNLTNERQPADEFVIAYDSLSDSQQNNNMMSTSLKGNSLVDCGDSMGGTENELLDSSSPASRSRDSRQSQLGSGTDVFPSEFVASCYAANQTASPSRSEIQSALHNQCPGNRYCADCDKPNPDWVSVNLGVLICLECCGAHRELGVRCSRTQSLTMDELSIGQLLLPRFVGNRLFNKIFESALASSAKTKPDENTDMFQRRAFIKSKYVDRLFVASNAGANAQGKLTNKIIYAPCDTASDLLRRDLIRAVRTGDLPTLLQVFAEDFDLMTPLHLTDENKSETAADCMATGITTALHVAVEHAASSSHQLWSSGHVSNRTDHGNLPLVEFIIQNSSPPHLQRANALGETALHHAVRHARVDALKLLLQAGGLPTPLLHLTNLNGQTAYQLCEQLLSEHPPDESPLAECLGILQLADDTSTADRSSAAAVFGGSLESSLHPPGKTDNQPVRAALLQVVNHLQSVKWGVNQPTVNFHFRPNKTTRSEPREIAAALSKEATTCNTYQPVPQSGLRFWNWSSSQTLSLTKPALSTLPRKKGLAPRPPTTAADEDAARKCDEFNQFPNVLRHSLLSSDVLSADGFSTVARTSMPTVPSNTHKRQITGDTQSPTLCRASDDHIDVLLDVLEEKPAVKPSNPSPPPVPPKPSSQWVSALYSTLPTRHSSHLVSSSRSRSPYWASKMYPSFSSASTATPCHSLSTVRSSLPSRNLELGPSSDPLDSDFDGLLQTVQDRNAEHFDELTFRRGEIIRLSDRVDDVWWRGHIEQEPWRQGLFPVSHVKRMNGVPSK